jgi:hypothetical protein
MINRVGYLISTNINYTAALERLLKSMEFINKGDVFIVSGGHSSPMYFMREDGYQEWHVTHNSFDYTALICLIENQWPLPDHIFLLHDTMELGERADGLIKSAPADLQAFAVWQGFCNLMLLRTEYANSRAKEILALKNCTKQHAVDAEGFLWRTLNTPSAHYPGECLIKYSDLVYHGAQRRVVYYTGVDITKYQANWGQNSSLDPCLWVVRP